MDPPSPTGLRGPRQLPSSVPRRIAYPCVHQLRKRRGTQRDSVRQQRRPALVIHHLNRSPASAQNPRRASSGPPLVSRKIRRNHQRHQPSLPGRRLLLLVLAVIRPHRRRDRSGGFQLGRCRPCYRRNLGIRLLLSRWRTEQVRCAGQPCCQGFVRV
jgi:hypothetical protein